MRDKGIKLVSTGFYHTMIYKNTGELLVFGFNFYGQLGIGNTDNKNSPYVLTKDINIKSICCEKYFSMMLKKNGYKFFFFLFIFKKIFIFFLKR